MKRVLWGAVALFMLVALIIGAYYYRLQSAARQWEGPVAEILSEKLEKDIDTMEVELTSRIDAPVDLVFRAFADPERGQEFSETIRYAKLLRHEGNRKVVEFEIVVLGQPQQLTLEFTFVPEAKRVAVKTVEHPLSEIHGEYTFVPSPDGQQTLIAYKGTVKDKVKLPVPLALQKSMLRETFVSTMRALQRGVESQRRTAREGQAAEQ